MPKLASLSAFSLCLPLLCLSLSGCNWDWFAPKSTKKKAQTTQTIKDFAYNNYNEKRENDWTLKGETAKGDFGTGFDIINPTLLYNLSDPKTTMNSPLGHWDSVNKTFALKKTVNVISGDKGQFSTIDLIYDLEKEVCKTDNEVTFLYDNVTAQGNGLLVELKDERMEIQRNVLVTIDFEAQQETGTTP